MKIIHSLLIVALMLVAGSLYAAEEMVSTGSGTIHQSDDLAVGDPYQGKNVSAAAEAGHPMTQAPYTENCQEARCIRAEKRQESSPYWGGRTQGAPPPAGTELVK